MSSVASMVYGFGQNIVLIMSPTSISKYRPHHTILDFPDFIFRLLPSLAIPFAEMAMGEGPTLPLAKNALANFQKGHILYIMDLAGE
jgi:hypothetical protein